MAIISNLQEFNNINNSLEEINDNLKLMPINKQAVNNDVKIVDIVKYIPNIMQEQRESQRENFRQMLEVLDFMADRNMILYNKAQTTVIVEKENVEKPDVKKLVIVTGIIFLIIKVAILII